MVTCNHMNCSQMRYAKWKKPGSKAYTLYDSTYMTLWERQNYKDRKQIIGCQGLDGEVDYKEVWGNFFCMMELF